MTPSQELAAGAPDIGDVLADLAANDAAISTFRASGRFTLDSPDLSAKRVFRQGKIKYQRPSSLYVEGRNKFLIVLFKLTAVGEEFLMEFPTSQENSFYQLEGEEFVDVPFSVSPADIAREMFLPERWSEIGPRAARVVAYDPSARIATLTIGRRNRPHRRVDVMLMDAEEPAWVIVSNTRLNDSGSIIATTTSTEYRVSEGVRFPSQIDSFFPTEATRMTLTLRNFRPNADLGSEDFEILERARELGLEIRASEVVD